MCRTVSEDAYMKIVVEAENSKKQVEVLMHAFKNTIACHKLVGVDFCDLCPIASRNNGLNQTLCPKQEYSKPD